MTKELETGSVIQRFWENMYLALAFIICVVSPGIFALTAQRISFSAGTVLSLGWFLSLAVLLFSAPILMVFYPGFLGSFYRK